MSNVAHSEKKISSKFVQNCNATSIHEIKNHEFGIFSEITSIIEIPSSSSIFCLDDPNLTKSLNVSSLKQNATKMLNQDLKNVTKNVFDQKSSNLCVPISVATLLRFAMKNDLGFICSNNHYTFEKILTTLTMIVYPRSMFGLNLNPNITEADFQKNDIVTLLERVCSKTYFMESGWEIIRQIGRIDNHGKAHHPDLSTCKYEEGKLVYFLLFHLLQKFY